MSKKHPWLDRFAIDRLSPSTFASRLLGFVARASVQKLGLPAALFGYRSVRAARAELMVICELHPPAVSTLPLPRNIVERGDLPSDRGRWGFAFRDVPDRRMRPTVVGTIRDCDVIISRDHNHDPYYAIVTRDRHVVPIRGTGLAPAFHRRLLGQRHLSLTEVDRGSWFLELWHRNYSHWLQWHLTKLAIMADLGIDDAAVLPNAEDWTGFVGESISMLGMNPDTMTRADRDGIHINELSFVNIDDYRPEVLQNFRRRVIPTPGLHPWRKIFVSRSGASRRRLVEEDEIWAKLQPMGYELLCMERLTFAEQVRTMNESRVLVSLHGSGLANMIFSPSGMHVVEISDTSFPNPQFYALAAALEHSYWLVYGDPVGRINPGYHDVSVRVADVMLAVDGVERCLEQPTSGGGQDPIGTVITDA